MPKCMGKICRLQTIDAVSKLNLARNNITQLHLWRDCILQRLYATMFSTEKLDQIPFSFCLHLSTHIPYHTGTGIWQFRGSKYVFKTMIERLRCYDMVFKRGFQTIQEIYSYKMSFCTIYDEGCK